MKVHRAGEPVVEPGADDGPGGPVQRCSDCGEVLQDYRGTMMLLDAAGEQQPLHWWSPGGYVLRDGPMTTLADAAEATAFACTKPVAQG